MVNHIRTLLLNQDAAAAPSPDYPGEQYVPTAFEARQVPDGLVPVRRVLFGATPDRAMLNYRLQQLLSLIHSCELEEFVTAKDSRITYWPFDDSILRAVVKGPVVTQIAGTATKVFYVLKSASATELSGRLRQEWRIDVLDSDTVSVQAMDDNGATYTVEQDYSTVDNLSSILTLPGSGLQYRFETGTGTGWLVNVLAKPVLSLPDVLVSAEAVMTDTVRRALFGRTPAEPYKTFQELWDRHDGLPYRLGALALALAYRMDEEK